MRILLINGNTTQSVTLVALDEARRSARADTEIIAVTGQTGARIIGTRVENAIAQREMIALAAAHAKGVDGVLLAVSYDTALAALREIMPMPVIGMTEAAMITAMMIGGGIGLIALGGRVTPIYRELIAGYGLDARIVGWRTIENSDIFTSDDPAVLDHHLVDQGTDLVTRAGAEVVVLLGAVLAGAPRRIQDRLPVPVLDGIATGIRQVEVMAHLAPKKATVGSHSLPGPRELFGVEPEIAALLGATDQD